jgi:hypothetical protein
VQKEVNTPQHEKKNMIFLTFTYNEKNLSNLIFLLTNKSKQRKKKQNKENGNKQ